MATHKTFSGMRRAVERMITELEAYPPDNDHDYRIADRKSSALFAECNALWSNPADAHEAAQLRNRLADAWNRLHYSV